MQIIGENAFPFSLDFTGNNANALAVKLLDVGFLIAQHIDRAAGMKTAHDHRHARGSEGPGHVHGSGKLVGLDADEADQKLGAGLLAPANNFSERYFLRGLIKGRDFDRQGAEHLACFDVFGETVQHVERVARQDSLPKTDDISIIVILGGLDQNDMKFFDFFQHRSHRLPPASACKLARHSL